MSQLISTFSTMPTIRNILRGKKAKASGEAFETFLKCCALIRKFDVTHLPPCGGRYIGRNKFHAEKMPFDMIFCKLGKAIFVDAKHTKDKNFSHSMVNIDQILSLIGKEQTGHTSGYIVNFETEDKVIFFPASKLWALKRGQSLDPSEGITIGNYKDINLDILLKGNSDATNL